MRKSVKWGIAAAVVLGLGLAGTASASAVTEDDPNKGKGLDDTGERHGIRYEGCNHFELVDPDAVEAWGRSNSWRFAKWALKLDELRANPEPAIVEAMTVLFPECPWPSPSSTTFGPQRLPWAEAMVMAKEALANLDMAGGGDPAASGSATGATTAAAETVARALVLGLRGQPRSGRRPRSGRPPHSGRPRG